MTYLTLTKIINQHSKYSFLFKLFHFLISQNAVFRVINIDKFMNVAQYGLTWQRSRTVKYIKSVSEQFNFHRHSLKLFPIYRVPHFFLLKTKQTNVDKCEQINCESIYCKPTFIHVKKNFARSLQILLTSTQSLLYGIERLDTKISCRKPVKYQ